MKFVELSEAEFKDFEQAQACGNFFQSIERKKLRKLMGWDVHLFGLKAGDDVKAAGLVMIKDGTARLALGPILDYKKPNLLRDFMKYLVEFCKKENLIEIEVFPPVLMSVRDVHGEKISENDCSKIKQVFSDLGFSYKGETVEIENVANRWMCVKDLSEIHNQDELRATYKKNVRNKLRKVSPLLEIDELTDKSQLGDFYVAITDSDKKNGVVSRKIDYWEDVWDTFGDKAHFVVVRKKETGEPVCARVHFDHPNEVVTFVSGTVQRFKRLNGMTFLQDWTLNNTVERGYKRINFYGLRGDFSKENHLLEFKSGFGVVIEEYVGGFNLILDPKRYRAREMRENVKNLARKVKREGVKLVDKLRKRQTKVVRKVVAKEESVEKK
jgi:Uncharacterized protein involved in methicillin resistance